MAKTLTKKICAQCLWLLLLFLSAVPCMAAEKKSIITTETPVTSVLLLQWLHSGNPRLVAWASDFARKRHENAVIEEMPKWLEDYANRSLIVAGSASQSEERRAITAVLDTLIQENVQVPIPVIKAVAESFPAQAVILISRLPLDASRTTLNDWTYGQQDNSSAGILARIATMILAKDPQSMLPKESSLASRVVASSEDDLRIYVRSNISNQGGGGGFISFICGADSFVSETVPGWPHIYNYELVENDPTSMKQIVVDLNDDRIAFQRFEKIKPGTCGTSKVDVLNPQTRHRLLAYWLGVREDHMLWQAEENFPISWTNYSSYQQELGELIEIRREKLQVTVEALYKRGILTESQKATLPRLVVTIKCDIKPCPLTGLWASL